MATPLQLKFSCQGKPSGYSIKLGLSGTSMSINSVDWGDGTTNTSLTHTYVADGSFNVAVSASGATNFNPNYYSSEYTDYYTYLTECNSFGEIGLVNLDYAFRGCTNLVTVPISLPSGLSTVTTTSAMFFGATSFNQDISGWNVSSITNMAYMFYDASSFNQPLNNWNVSNVAFMANMFFGATSFDQDISSWNVGNVTTMDSMFFGATSFNQDISGWNTSKVVNLGGMFRNTNFNKPIGSWNTGNVTNLNTMFYNATNFNQPLNNWNVSKVTDMSITFSGATAFNQDLNSWNTGNVTNMQSTFSGATNFNGNIVNWNTSKVTSLQSTFENAQSFNQPIGNWDVGNVTSLMYTFGRAYSFNQDIGNWNVGNVTNMFYTFDRTTSFNQPLNNWNVSNVTNFEGTFIMSVYNQPLSNWNMSKATNLVAMFVSNPNFNQDISGWNVGNVTSMIETFRNASSFNQPIGSWNTSKVTNMYGMFNGAINFNQDISGWIIGNVTSMSGFLQGANAMSSDNYNSMLIGWESQKPNIQSNVPFTATGTYTYPLDDGVTARTNLINDYNWSFNDTTPPPPIPPTAPASVTASNNFQYVDISWSIPSSPAAPITGYTVTSSPSGYNYTTNDGTQTSTSFTFTNYNVPYTFFVYASNRYGNGDSTESNPVTPQFPCFLEGSKILTSNGYIEIEKLRTGDLVKSVKHDFKPIKYIGKRIINHVASSSKIKDQLYRCSKDKYPELLEDLVITGCHSILVDSFESEQQKEKCIEINGHLCITDNKYRLPACADTRTVVYETPGDYTIYHFALENPDYFMNYGVYANGLLVETSSIRYMKELSGMELF